MRLRTRCFYFGGCLLLSLCRLSAAEDDGRYSTPEQAPAFREPVFITKPLDRAYPGAEYNTRPAVTGGTWPYRFALKAAPKGMKIDEKTGTITWIAPKTETQEKVTVALTDQAGRKAEQSFTIEVGKAGFYFVSSKGDDANPGTFEKPWKTVMRAAQPVEDASNTTLYLRGGAYAVESSAPEGKKNANVLRILRTSPRRWVAWPGEKPVIDLGWSETQWKAALEAERAKLDDQHKANASTQAYGHRTWLDQFDDLLFDGLEVKNAAYYMFQMNDGNRSRLTWRRCYLHHLYGDYAENSCFIFGFAPDRKWEKAAPGESFAFGKRPQTKPYRHLVVQECTLSDRPYYSPRAGGWHGGGLVWYATQGCLIEDSRFERIEHGMAILDKDNGWDNTYRNNVIKGNVMLSAQGCNDGVDVHHNFIDGNLHVGAQPGWLRNIWLHHNAIRGRVALMDGATGGPVEEVDAADGKLAGSADPKVQTVIRGYPRDRRLVFAWANAIDVPDVAEGERQKNLLVRIGNERLLRQRFVWWDGNLMDEAAVVAIGWTKSLPWGEFKDICGFDQNGATGAVAFDDEGRLPATSPWRKSFGRDAEVSFPGTVKSKAAEPSISGVSGVAGDGRSITISGRGFGIKSPVAPLKFDNFNDGAAGAFLQARDPRWKSYNGGKGLAYSDTFPHAGALALGRHNTKGEHFITNHFTFTPASEELFVSYWWKVVVVNPGKTVIKMTRLNSSEAAGGGGVYSGTGNTTLGGTYSLASKSGPYCAYNNGAIHETLIGHFNPPPTDTWIRVDTYKKLSTPGGADGVVSCRLHTAEKASNAAETRAKGQSFLLDTVILGTMEGAAADHDYWVYVDDVYIDKTRARVELCDAPRWTDRKHSEMQLPHTTWSDDKIEITVNRGSFPAGSTQYLYVVNRDGSANADGYPIVLGAETKNPAGAAGPRRDVPPKGADAADGRRQTPEEPPAFYFVSPEGDDASPGTIEKPWKSLARAAGSLQAGQTVFLRAGTYRLNEQVHPKHAGTKERPITFAGYKDEEAIIHGGEGTCFGLQGCKFIAFRGLKMTTSSVKVGAGMVYMEGSDGCRFDDCEFFGMPAPKGRENSAVIRCMRTGHGFSKDCAVRNCLFRDNGSPAVRLYTTKGWIIENNEFRNCLEAVIGGKDQPYDMVVRRNLIVGGDIAFYFAGQGGCGNVLITENVVVGARNCFQVGGLGTNGNKRADVRLVNNTFVECGRFISGWDDGFTTGQVYANNIFHAAKAENINSGADTPGRLVSLDKYSKNPTATATNYLMDWNCLSISKDDTSIWFINGPLRAKGLAEWTTIRPPFEQHSISADPQFVDTAKGDYHLKKTSPCKGKGRNGEDLGAYPRGDDGTVIGRVVAKH